VLSAVLHVVERVAVGEHPVEDHAVDRTLPQQRVRGAQVGCLRDLDPGSAELHRHGETQVLVVLDDQHTRGATHVIET
jgi:hypothetical protein